MEVILLEEVPLLGKMGEVVRVKDGYARNFLLPRRLCIQADIKSMKVLEHQKKVIQEKKQRLERDADSLKGRIEAQSISIAARAGEEDKLFGSVTNQDLEKALQKEGFQISRKDILLEDPIKLLGHYTVPIKLAQGVTAQLKFSVVRE